MDTLRTEEEQIEVLKRWWQDNGRSTVIAVAIGLAGYFGFQGWQQHQQAQAETASMLFQSMHEAISATAAVPNEALQTTARTLAEQLRSEFAGTTYAQFATLHLAKLAAQAGDWAQAETLLNELVNSDSQADVAVQARLRLARVLAEQARLDEALVLVQSAPVSGYEGRWLEVKGDILQRLERSAEARSAYEAALAAGLDSPLLSLKLAALPQAEEAL